MSNKANYSHEDWMKQQVESADEKVESGRTEFISNSEVKELMRARRKAIAENTREPLFGVLCGGGKDVDTQ